MKISLYIVLSVCILMVSVSNIVHSVASVQHEGTGNVHFLNGAQVCQTFGKLFSENCRTPNPSVYYGFGLVPNVDGEATTNATSFRMTNNEAMVIQGSMPVSAQYFNAGLYVEERLIEGQTVPLAASINTINLENIEKRAIKGMWHFSIIFSASADVTTAVKDYLVTSGTHSDEISTVEISPDIVHFGLGPDGDLLKFFLRLGPDKNGMDSALADASALKVHRYNFTGKINSYYSVSTPIQKGTGVSELDMYPDLQENVSQTLVDEVESYAASHTCEMVQTARVIDDTYTGLYCLQNNTFCSFDNPDASYNLLLENHLLSSHPNSFYLVGGVNHTITTKTSFTSLAVHHVQTRETLEIRDDELLGPFSPGYIHKLAYSCRRNDATCTEIPRNLFQSNQFYVMERAYLEPQTLTAPLSSELVKPIVYACSPKKFRFSFF